MIDFVSLETANTLKDKGFPQPKKYDGNQRYYVYGVNLFGLFEEKRKQSHTFAPSATDLLRDLGENTTTNLNYNHKHGLWEATLSDGLNDNQYFYNENPAEAVAEAWLAKYKNEKQ